MCIWGFELKHESWEVGYHAVRKFAIGAAIPKYYVELRYIHLYFILLISVLNPWWIFIWAFYYYCRMPLFFFLIECYTWTCSDWCSNYTSSFLWSFRLIIFPDFDIWYKRLVKYIPSYVRNKRYTLMYSSYLNIHHKDNKVYCKFGKIHVSLTW